MSDAVPDLPMVTRYKWQEDVPPYRWRVLLFRRNTGLTTLGGDDGES